MRPRPDGWGLQAGPLLPTLLLLLLLMPPPPLPLCRLWAAGTPTLVPGAQPDSSLGPGRVKRGWVWNQFFVVEEYTGTEPLYVGKVNVRPGTGPWGPDTARVKFTESLHPTPCPLLITHLNPSPGAWGKVVPFTLPTHSNPFNSAV